jgi:hypothetical protein
VPAEPEPKKAAPKKAVTPACFYLGREYDLATHSVQDRPLLYDARDLTTHGVVVGMTGSGKTGLCIDLLEEAALAGIPCILIDPKGDLTNLLLQFPDLDPKDFAQWLNPEDARQKGVPLGDYAQQLAEQYRKGLEEWGQPPERVRELKEAADYRVYTPGSEAGLPLSILQTFTAPKGATTREALNQKIDATTNALLGLTGIASDPVQSREHILIAQLLLHAWSKGRDLDLPRLITQIQEPPIRTIGAFDVDTFYPEKERLKLAVALNNILAAPSFSTWITGEALDLAKLMGDGKKPRHLIFYLAHLDDTQRLFFVTLLLEEVLSWTRRQTGTTSLRAILYFDEVFGYLPPHPGNPPTKGPLMTLLKQARAFGVGILLATQNPVDLDYKALSNAGTWFVGKLQTERDKARLIEGLQGVAAERGTLSDRSYLETVISALGNRVFLLHNVHRGQPLLFKSRFALSFLRGPLTRDQIEQLMQPIKDRIQVETAAEGVPPVAIPLCPKCRAELPASATVCASCGEPRPQPPRSTEQEFKEGLLRNAVVAGRPTTAPPEASGQVAPVLPAGVSQFYLPSTGPKGTKGTDCRYQASLLACAELVFADKRKGSEYRRTYRLLTPPPNGDQPMAWQTARPVSQPLAEEPNPFARWGDVPEALNAARKLKALERDFVNFLFANAKQTLFQNRKLELISEPGEDAQTFLKRCQVAARQEADKALAVERGKFEGKFAALNARLPEDRPPPTEAARTEGSWLDWLSFFSTSPAAASESGPKRTGKQREKLRTLEADWQAKKVALANKWKQIGAEYSEVTLKPRKADIRVTHFGVGWEPV